MSSPTLEVAVTTSTKRKQPYDEEKEADVDTKTMKEAGDVTGNDGHGHELVDDNEVADGDEAEDNDPGPKNLRNNRTRRGGRKRMRNEQQDILGVKNCDTDYYFSGHLRHVYPYYFSYKTFCKRRWVGDLVLNVCHREFRNVSREDVEMRIKTGLITINEANTTTEYKFKDNDRLASKLHRHELPILNAKLDIIHEDDKLLVVNKPPSWPVHPCGRYRFNTTLALLYHDHGFENLYVLHRLDRLTSGVLILSKDLDTSRKMHKQVSSRQVNKEYLARVDGEFPDGNITLDQPLENIDPKIGLNIVSPTGKDATTYFEKISFNGKSSLVRCKPLQGRTHQIRVHLQYLGFPIVNDPIYNSFMFGPTKGKGADFGDRDAVQLSADMRKGYMHEDWVLRPKEVEGEVEDTTTNDEEMTRAMKEHLRSPDECVFDPKKVTSDPGCDECEVTFRTLKAKDMLIFLHAIKYSGPDWSFESDPPFWAKEGFIAA